MNRKWLALGLAFVSGGSFGIAASWTYWENKANTKYREWVTLREGTEAMLKGLRENRGGATIDQIKSELSSDVEENTRLTQAYSSLPGPVVGRSYSEFELIDEAEYHSHEGHDKITIEIFRDDLSYQLVVDGETVIDWSDFITPHVIEELKGKTELYLRNHRKGEDYLVTWGQP